MRLFRHDPAPTQFERHSRCACLRFVGTCASTAALVIVLLPAAARAHHSIASVYDRTRSQTLEGTVVRFEFVSPHPFVTIDVPARDGKPRQWRLEMDNRWELAELGFTDDTLKPGDRIVVTGSLARAHAQGLYVRTLERPADGFRYEHHK